MIKAPAQAVSNLDKGHSFGDDLRIVKKNWQLYSLLVLPLLYYAIFKYGPMVGNVIAFRKFVPGGSYLGEKWVGLWYFQMFWQDPAFWNVFWNNIILSVSSLIIGFPFPIIFALLLNEVTSPWFKKLVQTTSYLPHFLSSVIIAGMIMEILAPSTGIVNVILKQINGQNIAFLQDPNWFRPIYIISGIWQEMGWGAILYLAALANVNMELYEAAKIDGANRWKQTLNITLPCIMPTIVVLLILNIGTLLGVGFEKILLLYNPLTYETADVISTYLYRMGMESNNFSYATAIGLFESLIGLVLVTLANSVSKRLTEHSLW